MKDSFVFVPPKSAGEMTIAELIERFESDIVYGCHSMRAEYSRSDARKEIVSRGNWIIPEIVTHLEANPPPEDSHGLRMAWEFLRQELEMCAA